MQTFSDEERLLFDQVQRVADEIIAANAAGYDQTGKFPWDSLNALTQLGLNGVSVPEAYGGTPISYRAYLCVVEMISEACAATGIIFGTTNAVVQTIKSFCNDEQKKRFLPKISEGAIGALAITEPSAGSDATAVKTKFEPSGTEIVVNGSKVFITSGDEAEFILLFGQFIDADHPKGALSALILEKGAPGFEVTGRETKMGTSASSTVALSFEDCRVPRENLVGRVGDGLRVMVGTLNKSRPSVAAQALGIATAAFKDAVGYANERRQGGKRVIDYQYNQFQLADHAMDLLQARSLLDYVGRLVDAEERDIGVEASMVKTLASDLAMRLTTDAVQIHGGYGYCKDFRVERLMRDAKITQIWEGTNQIQRNVIGRSLVHD